VNEIAVSPAWERLAGQDLGDTVVLVGASDTGKTTFARYLFEERCRRGACPAYLDADVGQSTLGLPTTQTVALAPAGAPPGDFPPAGPTTAFFLGDITPCRHFLPAIVGVHRLRARARSLGADVVIVDTTGLVDPSQGGVALKQWKIEILAAPTVVAFQRHDELEPLLWPLRRDGRVRVVELPVAPQVMRRTREQRVRHRARRFRDYFGSAGTHTLDLRRAAVYDLRRLAPRALLAFQDGDGFALALGVVEAADRADSRAVVRTPLPDLDAVASIRLGAARWDPEGGRHP
jgi:polynucleotide 5'-hydroxyl-kinase GRC3/NOL9